MSRRSTKGWFFRDGGWWKAETTERLRGNADFLSESFVRRDEQNRPIRNDGQVDTKQWIKEVNEGKWTKQ